MMTSGLTDVDILNFALNLEYVEAEYYLRGFRGRGLPGRLTTGVGQRGQVTGGSRVPFEDGLVQEYAREIARDELDHVKFLRSALGEDAVARPTIDFETAFTAAAQAAGLIAPDQTFDPFASVDGFLLGAFLFEDVGVTAYKGAARFIQNKDFLEAAAGILAVEAYHASNVRTVLLARGLEVPANAISDARDSLDGPEDLDQGITMQSTETREEMAAGGPANIVPADGNAIAFSRTPTQVLNIVYLTPAENPMPGGFFPDGLNGTLR
ncbi:MAG: ferritin-like domain-containing protein [Geminicoccaceae bacterium]|nr:ferritin-like domain-containing protein [Geminicoccaceae bacterium]